MSTLRVLYHLARADFLERTRRYSFLLMLGLVLWLGYLSASGQFRMRVPPDYLGVINSAWVGATMTITVTLLLGWFGFYLVKGSVSRDYETGVGQIMATTPLSRPLYTLGKWLSNFAVLALMILILLLVGVAMNLLVGTADFNLWALSAPLLFVALPCMALVAAVAVLFDTISWLRGGLGNIIYFCGFMVILATTAATISTSAADNPLLDFAGFRLIGGSVARAAQAAYPEASSGFAFSITELANPRLFLWNGIAWTPGIVLPRLALLLLALGLALLAAAFFDRFNPTNVWRSKRKPVEPAQPGTVVAPAAAMPIANARLTPLTGTRGRFRLHAVFMAELKLFLKGQPWWWYAIALGLVVAQLTTGLAVTRILLVAAWTWPIVILSGLGCREARHDTRQIVFSAPRPLLNQLPAAWLSACAVLALLGSGALLRFILAGETLSVLGWLTGVVFIASLALAAGVLTGSSKAFEVIYVFLMYMQTQQFPPFDFTGMTPASPWYGYALLAGLLLIAAALARRQQLTTKSAVR
jgi:hypothetical protein